jgi:hypothetical protein
MRPTKEAQRASGSAAGNPPTRRSNGRQRCGLSHDPNNERDGRAQAHAGQDEAAALFTSSGHFLGHEIINAMSAIGGKADVAKRSCHVCF